MVGQPLQSAVSFNQTFTPPLQFTVVSIEEIIANDYRMDASFYGTEGRRIRRDLEKCKWNIVNLKDFVRDTFYLNRFRRIYVDKGKGIPFILPSQITELYPRAVKFISAATDTDIESTRVKKGHVLLTCSGTIGVASYVSRALHNKSLSHDVIRIEAGEYSGYVYAYLKSKTGRLLVETNNYGSVVSHIEPEHLNNIPIPDSSSVLKQEIHNLIESSFNLRDESNELMDEAQILLKNALQLPGIETLHAQANQFDKKAGVLNYSVPSDRLDYRLDASYHVPVVQLIEQFLHKNAKEVTSIGDTRISRSVILPGRFKKVYIQEENGVPFFGGKSIYELDPSSKKYLSLVHHADRIKTQLILRENMTLITRSGTVGKVAIVPKHWESWTANEHIIRVVPVHDDIAGYMYAWLSSDYACPLITRFTYGAVIDEIDDKQVSQIAIPLLEDADVQKTINDTVLKANSKRVKAYALEQQALNILDEKVVSAQCSH